MAVGIGCSIGNPNLVAQFGNMQTQIGKLDILGLDVDIVLTDEPVGMGWLICEDDEVTLDLDNAFGGYSVERCCIWLDARCDISVMRSHLFHEVYHFLLGYLDLTYDVNDMHGGFMRFGNILWAVCRANADILFGNGLSDSLENTESGARGSMAPGVASMGEVA